MRLTTALQCDMRLQWRNGFYYASAVVVIFFIIILHWLPERAVAMLLPVVIFENVVTNSFYFVAGLVLLENGEGTRAAQIVTPMRRVEYIASKVLTLAVLSLVESLIITFVAQGISPATLPGVVPLAIGIALCSALFTLFGIALVCRYRSINEFLMPSIPYTMVLSLPILGWFGIGTPIAYDWHPLQGPLILMGVPFEPLSAGRLAYAIIWPLLWLWPVYWWSRRALVRSVMS